METSISYRFPSGRHLKIKRLNSSSITTQLKYRLINPINSILKFDKKGNIYFLKLNCRGILNSKCKHTSSHVITTTVIHRAGSNIRFIQSTFLLGMERKNAIKSLLEKFNKESFRLGDDHLLTLGNFLLDCASYEDLKLGVQILDIFSNLTADNLFNLARHAEVITGAATYLKRVNQGNTMEAIDQQKSCLYVFQQIICNSQTSVKREFLQTIMGSEDVSDTVISAIADRVTDAPTPILQELRLELLVVLLVMNEKTKLAKRITSVMPVELREALEASDVRSVAALLEFREIVLTMNKKRGSKIHSFEFSHLKNMVEGESPLELKSRPQMTVGWIDFCEHSFFLYLDKSKAFFEFKYDEIVSTRFNMADMTLFITVSSVPNNPDIDLLGIRDADDGPFTLGLAFLDKDATNRAHELVKQRLGETEKAQEKAATQPRKLSIVTTKKAEAPAATDSKSPVAKKTTNGSSAFKKLIKSNKNETESCELLTSPDTSPVAGPGKARSGRKGIAKDAPPPVAPIANKVGMKRKGPIAAPERTKPTMQSSKQPAETPVASVEKENVPAAINEPRPLQPSSRKRDVTVHSLPSKSSPPTNEAPRMRKQLADVTGSENAKSKKARVDSDAKSATKKDQLKAQSAASLSKVTTSAVAGKRTRGSDENLLGEFEQIKKHSSTDKPAPRKEAAEDVDAGETFPALDFAEDMAGTKFDSPLDPMMSQTSDLMDSSDLNISGFGGYDAYDALEDDEENNQVNVIFDTLIKKLENMQAQRDTRKMNRTINLATDEALKQIDQFLREWAQMHQSQHEAKEVQILQKHDSYRELNDQHNKSVAAETLEIVNKVKEIEADVERCIGRSQSAKSEAAAFINLCKDDEKKFKNDLAQLRTDTIDAVKKSMTRSHAGGNGDEGAREIAKALF